MTDMGSFCIDTNNRGVEQFFPALDFCRSRDGGGSRGRNLCTVGQWYLGCVSGQLLYPEGEGVEWVDAWPAVNGPLIMGGGPYPAGCTTNVSTGVATFRNFRCCQ
jgi:hypothetical protein